MILRDVHPLTRAVRLVRITLTVLLPIAFFLGLASWCSGCGPSLASIEAETVRCEAEVRAIVERVGTTEEEDLTDLAALRARCEEATR